jgi:hypothetical protein
MQRQASSESSVGAIIWTFRKDGFAANQCPPSWIGALACDAGVIQDRKPCREYGKIIQSHGLEEPFWWMPLPAAPEIYENKRRCTRFAPA